MISTHPAGRRWIRLPAVAYAAHTVAALIPILMEIWAAPSVSVPPPPQMLGHSRTLPNTPEHSSTLINKSRTVPKSLEQSRTGPNNRKEVSTCNILKRTGLLESALAGFCRLVRAAVGLWKAH